MPTFGKTSIGASFNNFPIGDALSTSRFTLSETGVVTKLTLYYKGTSVSPLHEAGDVRAVIFSVAAGEPDELVALSDAVNSPTTDGWIDFPISPSVELPPGDYYLGAHSALRKVGAMDTAGTNRNASDTYSDGTLTTWPGGTTSTLQKSVYATYDRVLNAAKGTYAITGKASGLLSGRVINSAKGSYTITGKTSGVLATRLINAVKGTYAITGKATDLVYGSIVVAYSIAAMAGSYFITGKSTGLDKVTALNHWTASRGVPYKRRRY